MRRSSPRWLELCVALALGACRPPPTALPPLAQALPPAPATPAPIAPIAAPPTTEPEPTPPLAPPEPVAAPEPPPPTEPKISIVLETPYKMDERVEPKTQEAYKRDILDRRHWNKGGTGELIGELAKAEGHPDPRVRVNIDKVHGPHKAADLQRHARQYHWINVVRCYRLGYWRDPHLRGWTKAVADVAKSGKVRGARLLSTELKDAPGRDVAKCMTETLEKLKMPGARAGSRMWVDMKVSAGDEPSEPPAEEIKPGDGKLTVEAMQQGVEAGLPHFEQCYRDAFGYAPGLWGRMVLRFHVDEHGTLKGVFEAGSRFPAPRVQQCVLHAARKLRFPKPDGGEIRFFAPLRLSTDRADSAPAEPTDGSHVGGS